MATNPPVQLIKMCEMHGIDLPPEGDLVDHFRAAFPAARYDGVAREWRMEWKRGTFKDSNAKLEEFFAARSVPVVNVDKC